MRRRRTPKLETVICPMSRRRTPEVGTVREKVRLTQHVLYGG